MEGGAGTRRKPDKHRSNPEDQVSLANSRNDVCSRRCRHAFYQSVYLHIKASLTQSQRGMKTAAKKFITVTRVVAQW